MKCLMLALLALLLSACSMDTVSQDLVSDEAIHLSYHIRYDSNDSKINFFAQARVGGFSGTTVELVEPSKFIIHGDTFGVKKKGLISLDEPTSYPFVGTFYQLECSTDRVQDSYEITWIKKDGSEVLTTIPMPNSSKLITLSKKFRTGDPIPFAWIGNPLEDNESLELSYAYTSQGQWSFKFQDISDQEPNVLVDVYSLFENPLKNEAPASLLLKLSREISEDPTEMITTHSFYKHSINLSTTDTPEE